MPGSATSAAGVADQDSFGEGYTAVAGDVDVRDALEVQHRAEAGGDQVAVVQQQPGHPGAHRSATEQANIDFTHDDIPFNNLMCLLIKLKYLSDSPHGLVDAHGVFDQREAHELVPVLPEPEAG